MRKWVTLAVVAMIVCSVLAIWLWPQTPVPPGLGKPERMTLFSIDGRSIPRDPNAPPPPGELLHGFPVLGKVDILDADARSEIAAAVRRGLAESDPNEQARCFWPRHVLRVVEGGRSLDYVICFQCKNVEVHPMTPGISDTITRRPQRVLNKYLHEARIPLAPGSVEDEE